MGGAVKAIYFSPCIVINNLYHWATEIQVHSPAGNPGALARRMPGAWACRVPGNAGRNALKLFSRITYQVSVKKCHVNWALKTYFSRSDLPPEKRTPWLGVNPGSFKGYGTSIRERRMSATAIIKQLYIIK